MTTFLRRMSGNFGGSHPDKQAKRFSFLSYGRSDAVAKDMIKVDFTTGHTIGDLPAAPLSYCSTTSSSPSQCPVYYEPAPYSPASARSSSYKSSSPRSWSPAPYQHSSSSSIYSERPGSFLSDASSETLELRSLLRQPEMNVLLKGRRDFVRTLNVQGVLVRLTDERIPEIIGRTPYLRTIWTFSMVDMYRYDVDDQVLRMAMGTAPIAVCNHLAARAPDGYGESSLYSNWPVRQPDEECVPDDGFRLSVQCKSCEAMYSVEVASTRSSQWDGTFEPYLRVQSWRPV